MVCVRVSVAKISSWRHNIQKYSLGGPYGHRCAMLPAPVGFYNDMRLRTDGETKYLDEETGKHSNGVAGHLQKWLTSHKVSKDEVERIQTSPRLLESTGCLQNHQNSLENAIK